MPEDTGINKAICTGYLVGRRIEWLSNPLKNPEPYPVVLPIFYHHIEGGSPFVNLVRRRRLALGNHAQLSKSSGYQLIPVEFPIK
jgi:hypothetical protein